MMCFHITYTSLHSMSTVFFYSVAVRSAIARAPRTSRLPLSGSLRATLTCGSCSCCDGISDGGEVATRSLGQRGLGLVPSHACHFQTRHPPTQVPNCTALVHFDAQVVSLLLNKKVVCSQVGLDQHFFTQNFMWGRKIHQV